MPSKETTESAWENLPTHGNEILEVEDLPPDPKNSVGLRPD